MRYRIAHYDVEGREYATSQKTGYWNMGTWEHRIQISSGSEPHEVVLLLSLACFLLHFSYS